MSAQRTTPNHASRRLLVAGAFLALAALLASACGSTVPLSEREGRAMQDDFATDLREADGDSLDGEVAGTGPGTATRSRAAPAPGAATPGGGQPAADAGAAVTDDELKVGIAYLRDPGAANAAVGFAGIGQIDQRRGWDAMIELVNENPPHGRRVTPVYYSYSTNDLLSKGSEQIYQEMCTHWTRDNRVFLAWATGLDTLRSCLTEAGVPQVGSGAGFSYARTFEDYPYYVEHNGTALDRMAQFQVDQLVERGFFATCKRDPSTEPCIDGKPRIALIRYDQPPHDAAAETMKSTLAAHGLRLCEGCEFEISYSSDDVANQLADATEVNSAINACRTPRTVPGTDTPAGPCTHVLFLGSRAGVRITLFYVQRAEDQGYRAKLGFNTQDAPMAARDFYAGQGQTRYFNQFRESMLVSTVPGDFTVRPEAHEECKEIFERAGETFGGSDDSAGNKEGQIGGWCDTAWYHKALFEAIGPQLSLETFLQGVAQTGPVKSATTFLMQTSADRRDGAGAVRIGEWFDDCDCIRAVTGDIPV